MATSFSVTDILADVARRANVPAFTTTTNVTTAQATGWLVQSARSLSALFRQKLGEDNDFIQQGTLTVQANVGLASLPSNCGEVHALLWVRSTSDYRLLDAADLDQFEDLQTGDIRKWTDGPAPTYRLMGNTVTFFPPSSEEETVLIYYTTHLDLTGQTSFFARLDADLWLTLDVVCKLLNAQGRADVAAVYLQEKMMLEANLFSGARERDPYQVNTIRDTKSRRARGRWRDRWED